MNEESFVRKLTALFPQSADVAVGPGDDCAVLDLGTQDLLLAAVDQVISDVHYTQGTSPASIAGKLLKRNVSDIAAMGGVPTHVLLSLAVDPMDEGWLLEFHRGMADLASKYGISVIGGDMAKLFAPGEALSLTILGKVERNKLCLRSNANAGDLLYATGEFGNSFRSGHHLDFLPRLPEARFLAGDFTCAMQDVSDGLLKDAARMAEASGLALELEPDRIPLRAGASRESALTEGEDYELLFAVPESLRDELERRWDFPGTALTCLGRFVPGTPGAVSGLPEPLNQTGYDHFR
ncbi:MAG: thiamine-monophosphate kinase [Lentisphaeria bacterium]|nr:thiamine-monophosphate kinase [Lentisphaeria bacterium]